MLKHLVNLNLKAPALSEFEITSSVDVLPSSMSFVSKLVTYWFASGRPATLGRSNPLTLETHTKPATRRMTKIFQY
jgi:hypothetical protein